MANKIQNGTMMTRKIILFIFISIIYNNTSYGFMTKNYYTDYLGEACENNIHYQNNQYSTGGGILSDTYQLDNCTKKQKVCYIEKFKDNTNIEISFNHKTNTLSTPNQPNIAAGTTVHAVWKSDYYIQYDGNEQQSIDCTQYPNQKIEKMDKLTCSAGETFSYYLITMKQTGGPDNTCDNKRVNDNIPYNRFSDKYNLMHLEPQIIPCPKGYYCEGEKNCFENKKPCPAGHTTDGTGAKSKAECIITDKTEFCDRNGCFKIGNLK